MMIQQKNDDHRDTFLVRFITSAPVAPVAPSDKDTFNLPLKVQKTKHSRPFDVYYVWN